LDTDRAIAALRDELARLRRRVEDLELLAAEGIEARARKKAPMRAKAKRKTRRRT